MTALFVTLLVIGGGVLALQFVLGLLGGDHAADTHGAAHATDALDLLSVRSVAAGLAFSGVGGIAARSWGWPAWLQLLVALVAGAAGLVAVAALFRSFRHLEHDGSLRIEGAVGLPATVYLAIPGAQAAPGKVTLALQGRTVELNAVTRGEPLPTGATVTVVDVLSADTVEVTPLESLTF